MSECNDDARTVVLVVDDEAGVRALSRRILEIGGYRVIEAADGPQALEVIDRGTRVDVLMVDLAMPIMRGDELAERLRAIRPDLRVLYVTAHSDALFSDRPELRANAALLDKPFSVNDLLDTLSLFKDGHSIPPAAASSRTPPASNRCGARHSPRR